MANKPKSKKSWSKVIKIHPVLTVTVDCTNERIGESFCKTLKDIMHLEEDYTGAASTKALIDMMLTIEESLAKGEK